MSIERSGTATSAKSVAGAESHKGKVKSADAPDALATGGFSALLTSLETQADPVDTAGPKVATEEPPPMAVLPSLAPATAAVPDLPLDLSLLLAQAGVQVGAQVGAQAGEVAADGLSASVNQGRPAGVQGGIRLTGAAMAAGKAEVAVAAAPTVTPDKSAAFRHSVDAQFEEMVQAPARTRKAGGAEFQSGVSAILSESRVLKLATLMDVSVSQASLSAALVSSGIGDSFLRQSERVSAKSSLQPAGAGIEGPWGQHALQAETRVDSPSATADASMLSLESMVADTVSHWVTQGVQNAELKLDGLGSEPVEVRISLHGDEAHIGFRTDQPEIRQLLEGAAAHLKDLLASEGLVLSGVSVGTSGQNGAGTQERPDRPGVRQARLTTTDAPSTESAQRAHHAVGRAVDIFV